MESYGIIFKANNRIFNLPTEFCLESIYNGFDAIESRGVSLKRNVYYFSVDHDVIDKSDKLNIHKYLIVKNSIKHV